MGIDLPSANVTRLAVGDSLRLSASIRDHNGAMCVLPDNEGIRWRSSATAVVAIDASRTAIAWAHARRAGVAELEAVYQRSGRSQLVRVEVSGPP